MISWYDEAKAGRSQVAKYIHDSFGDKRVKQFRQSVKQTVQMINRHPEIGPIDPLFADRARTYRSVVVDSLSKMVYFVEGDIIYIAAFWDCRMDPSTEADRVEVTCQASHIIL